MHSTESLLGKWVLPEDVLWIPANELSKSTRDKLELEDADVILTRQGSRSPSKALDSQSAQLIKEFQQKKTLAEAVVDYACKNAQEPMDMFEQITPLIRRLVKARLLLAEKDSGTQSIYATFNSGEMFHNYQIENLLQVLEDSEVYMLRSVNGESAVLKIARPERAEAIERLFSREAKTLEKLNGRNAPRLLQAGQHQQLSYIIMSYLPGQTLIAEAAQRRNAPLHERRVQMIELLANIAKTYAELHEQGILHGDVHPRNGLIQADHVSLIDFGLATWEDANGKRTRARRGGIPEFYDPDYAAARLADKQPQQQSFLGEQYSVGALLFLLATGCSYQPFAAERNAMYQQILKQTPLGFVQCGLPAWPELESILGRAMAKKANKRWPSMGDMAQALLTEHTRLMTQHPHAASTQQANGTKREAYIQSVLEAAHPTTEAFAQCFTEAPIASVNYGASGLAYALLRIAEIRQSAAILAKADVWNNFAISVLPDDLGHSNPAFHNKAMGISPRNISSSSVYHGAPGLYWVQALISSAMGDFVSTSRALSDFVSTSTDHAHIADYTLGSAGVLTGCAMLLAKLPDGPTLDFTALAARGDKLFKQITDRLRAMHPIGQEDRFDLIGGAHGWTGALLALLTWCECTGHQVPNEVQDRLQQLARIGLKQDNWIAWPRKRNTKNNDTEWLASWCNGSAGLVPLWTTGWRVLGDQRFLELATLSAEHADKGVSDRYAGLCCGLAGRSFALLDMYANTADTSWLARAENLGNLAVNDSSIDQRPWSLFKGRLGVALLMEELKSPAASSVPLYGYRPSAREKNIAAARIAENRKLQSEKTKTTATA